MNYISETYTASGWERNRPQKMSQESIDAIRSMARKTPRKRVTEGWVLSAADGVVGAVGVGPQIGQKRVVSVENWQYFQSFAAK